MQSQFKRNHNLPLSSPIVFLSIQRLIVFVVSANADEHSIEHYEVSG